MKTKLAFLLLLFALAVQGDLITFTTNFPAIDLTPSADGDFNPQLNINSQHVWPAITTNVFASGIVLTSLTNAPSFAQIGSVTNQLFIWSSNSIPPTIFGSYYDAATNLHTKWTQ